MKHYLLTMVFAAITLLSIQAQVVPNGNFESWTTDNNSWHLTNLRCNSTPDNRVVQYQPAHGGSYAVKVATQYADNGIEFEPGILLGSWTPSPVKGGFPYSQKPTKLNVWVKYDVQAGDKASIVVAFKKNGALLGTLSDNILNVSGSSTTNYTQLSLDLKPLTETPDTVLYIITSGDALKLINDDNTYVPTLNSYIIVDDMSFDTGTVPYGDFEAWGRPVTYATNWGVQGAQEVVVDCNVPNPMVKTTDSHSGSYAMKATTHYNPYWESQNNTVTSGYFGNYVENTESTFPMTLQNGYLTGWYKYIPVDDDSAAIHINLFKNGNPIGGQMMKLPAASEYTQFAVPFNVGEVPDQAGIIFQMSKKPLQKYIGSTLYLDDLSITQYDAGLWKALTGGTSGTKTWKLDINSNTQKSEFFHNPLDFYGDGEAGGSLTNTWGPSGGINFYQMGMAPEIGTITFNAATKQVTLKLDDGVNANGYVNRTPNGDGTYSINYSPRNGTFTGSFSMSTQPRINDFLILTNGQTLWENMILNKYSYLQSLSAETAWINMIGDVRFPLDKTNVGCENLADLNNYMIMHCSENALVVRVKRLYNGMQPDGTRNEQSAWHLYNFIPVTNSTDVTDVKKEQSSIVALPGKLVFTSSPSRVEVFNINGQLVKTATNVDELLTNDLTRGIYMVKATFNDGTTGALKFIR
jgi:hypothetical protein